LVDLFEYMMIHGLTDPKINNMLSEYMRFYINTLRTGDADLRF